MSLDKSQKVKVLVDICGYNGSLLLERKTLSISEYYDSDIPLVDNDEYRRIKCVNKVRGTIYNEDLNNKIIEQFVNRYDKKGRLIVSNKYNSDLVLIDTSLIYYDYNDYTEYCELRISTFNNNFEFTLGLMPRKRQKYVITISLMEFCGDKFVLANKIKVSKTSKKFFRACSCFDIYPNKKYRFDVSIEMYNRNVDFYKSELISNVLGESFDNALTKGQE